MTKVVKSINSFLGADPAKDEARATQERLAQQTAAANLAQTQAAAAVTADLSARQAADAAAAAEAKRKQDEIAALQAAEKQAADRARSDAEDADRQRRAARRTGGRRGLLTFAETGSTGLSSFLGGGR